MSFLTVKDNIENWETKLVVSGKEILSSGLRNSKNLIRHPQRVSTMKSGEC